MDNVVKKASGRGKGRGENTVFALSLHISNVSGVKGIEGCLKHYAECYKNKVSTDSTLR